MKYEVNTGDYTVDIADYRKKDYNEILRVKNINKIIKLLYNTAKNNIDAELLKGLILSTRNYWADKQDKLSILTDDEIREYVNSLLMFQDKKKYSYISNVSNTGSVYIGRQHIGKRVHVFVIEDD